MRRPFVLSVLLLGASLAGLPARADSGHDRARAALAAGEVLPLSVLLERVGREHPGHVLEVELEREHGRWIYELKLLQSGGALLRLKVDASDATVLRQRGEKR